MIRYPAIIRHGGDPELTYLPDSEALDMLDSRDVSTEDYLIDSDGRMFSLISDDSGLKAEMLAEVMPLHELLGLVRAHAANTGSCCVAKMYAPTIEEAIKIIASLED